MVGVGAWVATVAAYLFDYAVQISLSSAAYALDFIAIGWGVVRDIANMSFLFILVYIAFKIMFQSETTGTIRMLTWVVVMALLVNFSFVLTRVAVDTGNILAVQFYNAIQAPLISQTAAGALPQNQLSNAAVTSGAVNGNTKDLTAAIMNALNVQSLTNTTNFQSFVQNQGNSPMFILIVLSVIYILTGIALYMVGASFLFVGIKFILRVIGLWFLIIGAPIAFITAIFRGKEGGSKWFNLWLKYLLKFSAYPAIFLGMFWIQTIFMNEMAAGTPGSLFNGIVNTVGGSSGLQSIAAAAANVSVRLGFIVATLWISLKVADWAVSEMSVATNLAKEGLNRLGGALRFGSRLGGGALAFAGAPLRPAGRLLQAGVQNQTNVAERNGVNGMLWRGVNRVVGNQNTNRSQVLLDRARKNAGKPKETESEESKNKRETEAQAAKEAIKAGTLGAQVEGILRTQGAPAQQAQPQQTQTQNNRPTRAPGTTAAANPAANAGNTPQVMNVSAQQAIEALRAGGQRAVREQVVERSSTVQGIRDFANVGETKEYGERIQKLNEKGDEIKRLVKEQSKKIAELGRAGAVAGSMSVSSPDMSRVTQKTVEPIRENVGEMKEEIKNLNNTVRTVTNALRNNQTPPTKIIIEPVRPQTGTPAAPAAAKPAPKPAPPEDYPYSEAAE
ncbi:MAG: hypothetical protein V4474_02220 [Patescibacteria group bacterium]